MKEVCYLVEITDYLYKSNSKFLTLNILYFLVALSYLINYI